MIAADRYAQATVQNTCAVVPRRRKAGMAPSLCVIETQSLTSFSGLWFVLALQILELDGYDSHT